MGEQTERLVEGMQSINEMNSEEAATVLQEGMLLEIALAVSRCADALEKSNGQTDCCPDCTSMEHLGDKRPV